MQNEIKTTGERGEIPSVGKILIFAYDYPVGNRAYGGGGWSKHAKSKPAPVVVRGEIDAGGKMECGGKVRRKFTAFDMSTTPPTLIRRDYALDDLRKLGADIPKLYSDELGNMRDSADKLVMAGPNSWGPSTFVK
jgi:hypothetical protein